MTKAKKLLKVVLYEVKRLACFASEYENDFIKAMIGRSAKVAENGRIRKQRELDTLTARDRELDMLFERLYEDNVAGKIDDARFSKMSKRYEQEQGENAKKNAGAWLFAGTVAAIPAHSCDHVGDQYRDFRHRLWPHDRDIPRVQKRRFSSKGGVRAFWEPGFSKPVKKSIKDVKSVTLGCFIRDKLHLEMSEEKTLITHGHDAAKFLGYEVTIAKGEHNKKTKTGATRRVNNGKVLLYVPHDKWVKRLFSYNALKIKYDKQNGNKEVWEPVRRTRLLHLDDLEILNQYNAEIRGLYNYYRLANNVSVLNNFYYVMRYSMLKTFAGKYRTRISRIIRKYRQGKDFVVEYPKKNGKVGKVLFYNNGFRRNTKVESGNPDIVARVVENYGRNSLIKRLQANQCEWCGAENVPLEIHHVRKLKDLSGRKQWEIAMIGRKRKTMALCV